jgi:hypothetical protein
MLNVQSKNYASNPSKLNIYFFLRHLGLNLNYSYSSLDGAEKKETIDLEKELATAKLKLEEAIRNYKKSSEDDSKSFQLLANGVFQAEGHISAGFRRNNLTVTPVALLGQNYSKESLAFFVKLYHELGKVGSLSIRTTSSDNLYIS